MAKQGVSVHIDGDWNNAGVKAAQRDISAFGRQADGFSKSFTKSMFGAGAALGGAFAIGAVAQQALQFLGDAVTAFLADEAAAAKLATTMGNLGFDKAVPDVEKLIDAQQRLTGIADDKLRPAFDRLVRSTRDVGEASKLLVLAQDVAVGTGKELSAVVEALGRSASGSNTALGKLGTGLSKTAIESNTFQQNVEALSGIFTGQAAVAADTYQGQIGRLQVGFSELTEALGRGFVTALGDTTGKTGGLMQSMKDLEPAMQDVGAAVGNSAEGLVQATIAVYNFQKSWERLAQDSGVNGRILAALGTTIYNAFVGPVGLGIDLMTQMQGEAAPAIRNTANAVQIQGRTLAKLKDEYGGAGAAARGFAGTQNIVEAEVNDASVAILKQWAAMSQTDLAMQDAGTRGIYQAVADDNTRLAAAADLASISVASVGGSTGGAAKETFKFKDALAAVNADGLERLNANLDTAKKAFDDFNASISGGISGQLDFAGAADDAKKGGTGIVDGIVAQSKGIVAFGDQLKELLKGSLSEESFLAVAALSAERGAALATELLGANGATLIANLNTSVAAVNTVADAVGLLAAEKWRGTGVATATAAIEGFKEYMGPDGLGRKRLMKVMDNLADAASRDVRIGVFVTRNVNEIITSITRNVTGPQAREHGGPVVAGQSYLVGEVGKELFTPSQNGTITPNDQLGGGNSYNINVVAGVGDPRAIGQQIVEYVKKFEKANGPVFVAA